VLDARKPATAAMIRQHLDGWAERAGPAVVDD
jgi:hypothetical protein